MLFCLVYSTSEHLKGNDASAWRFKEMCGVLFIKANSKTILKFKTPYMANFVIISNIIWSKALSHDEQVVQYKKSLNVQHGTFHPIIIKKKSYILLRCHVMND